EARLRGVSDTTRLAPGARALAGRLAAIEGELYQVRNRSFQDPLNFPPMLVERISGLSGMVAGVDARPPAQAYDVYRMFAAELQRQQLALQLGGEHAVHVERGAARGQCIEDRAQGGRASPARAGDGAVAAQTDPSLRARTARSLRMTTRGAP